MCPGGDRSLLFCQNQFDQAWNPTINRDKHTLIWASFHVFNGVCLWHSGMFDFKNLIQELKWPFSLVYFDRIYDFWLLHSFFTYHAVYSRQPSLRLDSEICLSLITTLQLLSTMFNTKNSEYTDSKFKFGTRRMRGGMCAWLGFSRTHTYVYMMAHSAWSRPSLCLFRSIRFFIHFPFSLPLFWKLHLFHL